MEDDHKEGWRVTANRGAMEGGGGVDPWRKGVGLPLGGLEEGCDVKRG